MPLAKDVAELAHNVLLAFEQSAKNLAELNTMWEALEKPQLDPEPAESAEPSPTGRILAVDDDPHFLRVLSRILTGEKFNVTTSVDACQALELLKTAQFDLIICDLRMPECDGLNFLQGVRSAGNNVPVIMLTAYGEVETYLDAMNAGATEYLNKPIKSDELVKVVRSCLRAHNNRKNHGINKP